MKFYSVVTKKSIDIPLTNVREVVRGGRKFAVGKYKVNGVEREAWRVLGKDGLKGAN